MQTSHSVLLQGASLVICILLTSSLFHLEEDSIFALAFADKWLKNLVAT